MSWKARASSFSAVDWRIVGLLAAGSCPVAVLTVAFLAMTGGARFAMAAA